jgi:hypothetical protein
MQKNILIKIIRTCAFVSSTKLGFWEHSIGMHEEMVYCFSLSAA